MNKYLFFIIVIFVIMACNENNCKSDWKNVSCNLFSLEIPIDYSFEDNTNNLSDWKNFVVKNEHDSIILNIFESSIPNGTRPGIYYGNLQSNFQLIDSHIGVDGLYNTGGPAAYSVLYGRNAESGISSFVHFVYNANSPYKSMVDRIIQSIKAPQKYKIKTNDISLPFCKKVEKVLSYGYSASFDEINKVCKVKDIHNEEIVLIMKSNYLYPPLFKPLPDSLLTPSFVLVDYYKDEMKTPSNGSKIRNSEIYAKINDKKEPEYIQFIYKESLIENGLVDIIRPLVVLWE